MDLLTSGYVGAASFRLCKCQSRMTLRTGVLHGGHGRAHLQGLCS